MSDAGEKLRKAHLAISSEETLQLLLTTFLSMSTRALLLVRIVAPSFPSNNIALATSLLHPHQYIQDLLQNLHNPQARQALLQAFQDPQVLQTFLDSNPDLLRKLQLADHQAEDNYFLTHGPAVALWLSCLLASFVLAAWDNNETGVEPAAQDQHGSLAARLALNLRMGCLTLALNWACCEVLDAMAMRAPSDSWQRQVFITLRCSVLSVLVVGMSVAIALLSADE
ncbi:hypothetical protein LTR35_006057 [Friedmanniomyces endolithicus]|nr:hypothetical protein LTR35_006057 [Friedmanniomyces endolithicus]KAK0301468.1 hypothetical protein LTS00_000617 [Friedmanniomyces endolithicus]KAK1014347.1 hypothetical protein LTR54_003999 [Friedmanniomyces endolithicus]